MPSFWNAQVMSKDWLSIIDDTIGWAHAGSDTLQIVLDGLIANWHSDVTALSDTLWWEPLSPSYVIPECTWISCTEIFYDVTPQPETVTKFFLDWQEYILWGGDEAVRWNITWTLSDQTDLNTALSAKANDSDVVKLSGTQTINWQKTFWTSPIVPSKTSAATNTWTAIATEAQVYAKQNKLTAQTAYTSKGSATKVPQITTNTLWQVTWITEVTIQQPDISWKANISDVLTKTNTTSYTPSADYQPATKKYVDDNKTEYSAGEWIAIWTIHSDMQWPAPDGFHIPLYDERKDIVSILKTTFWLWNSGFTYLKLPIAGRRGMDWPIYNVGWSGFYWSSSVKSDDDRQAYNLSINSSWFSTGFQSKAQGYSIRCFKDSPIIPDSSWTVLYNWNSVATWAWVFYNASLWLISVSWDGSTWYTIQDKNLWATNVYNNWDTLTDDNCGYFYQRWNNYWFPHSWEIDTSSTPIDATWYWPWNYYESNIFIALSSFWSWESSSNNNLRWWVTQWTWIWGRGNIITNTWVLSVNGQTGDVTISWATWWNITWTLSNQTDLQTALNWKQDSLTTQTAYSAKGSATKVPQITTNSLWQVTWITEVNVTYPSQVSDTAYASSWNWVTTIAPSKNAVYDKIAAMDTTIGWKQDTISDLATIRSWASAWATALQPSAISDAAYASSWDWVTTVAPSKNAVYDKISAMDTTISWKQATLVSGTNIKTINSTSLLWSGNISIAEFNPWSGTTWQVLTKTANSYAWSDNGTWDMSYSDFGWATKSWATVTLDLASTISPAANFTVNAPSSIKDGQTYILRVSSGETAYTMTLWTNITNPYDTDITLTANWLDQFVFLAIGGNLELQPEAGGGWSEWGETLAPNSPLKPKYKWYGTQAEYEALTQYYTDEEWDTVYYTI